eukprot:2411161-Amphidinium_carterae.1
MKALGPNHTHTCYTSAPSGRQLIIARHSDSEIKVLEFQAPLQDLVYQRLCVLRIECGSPT